MDIAKRSLTVGDKLLAQYLARGMIVCDSEYVECRGQEIDV